MASSKRLVNIGRKWEKLAAMGRRISAGRTGECSRKSVADKGHFVVYTVDRRRFVVPLPYLKSSIFIELFKMSEEAFGLSCNGPITLPCDRVFMEYVISSVQKCVPEEVERALLLSLGCQLSSLASSLHLNSKFGLSRSEFS